MKTMRDKFISFFFPKTCISCGKTGEYLCVTCKSKLNPHPEICPYCHRTSLDYQTCLDCKITPYNMLEWVIIPFSYGAEIKKLIVKFKYNHQKDLTNFLVDRMILAIQTNKRLSAILENPSSNVVLSFVPAHRYRKHFVKWYNQAQLLAENIAEKIQIPVAEILQKPQMTKAQAKLQRNQRLVNLQGKFILNPNIQLLWDETIILIDDVTTTNATLNELATTIKIQYPQIKVWGLVLARHN